MSRLEIVLTPYGDALILPDPPEPFRGIGQVLSARVEVSSDDAGVRNTVLGQYPANGKVLANPEPVNSSSEPAHGMILGMHKSCGSHLRFAPPTTTHQFIVCANCCLRVPVPREVKTYGKLKEYIAGLSAK